MPHTIIISIITCVFLIISILFFPKFKIKNFTINTFWVVALLGAICILLFSNLTINEALDGITSSSSINPIKILIIFFSMTVLSIFLDEVGFFKFIATLLINKCKTNQKILFLMLYILVSVLTVFTSNDIVILTFTPFICYFAKNTKINPIPYLVAEFAAANTWSMMLIIGNPTNIYLGSYANISFIDYLDVMFLPTVLAGCLQLVLMTLLFYKQLCKPISLEKSHVRVKSKLDLVFGLGHLLVCIIMLTISSYLNVSMWLICVICASSLIISITSSHIIRHKRLKILFKTFKRLPYELIPFVLSMFIIVLALNKNGVTNYISSLLGNNHIILKYGITSYLSCNLINNIPMSVMFASIPNFANQLDYAKAIYAITIGSNIGAFLTPIGALAGIMFTDLLNRQQVKYGFKDFIKYGIIISIPTLLIALLGLFISL